jgi:hypothetical protein
MRHTKIRPTMINFVTSLWGAHVVHGYTAYDIVQAKLWAIHAISDQMAIIYDPLRSTFTQQEYHNDNGDHDAK